MTNRSAVTDQTVVTETGKQIMQLLNEIEPGAAVMGRLASHDTWEFLLQVNVPGEIGIKSSERIRRLQVCMVLLNEE